MRGIAMTVGLLLASVGEPVAQPSSVATESPGPEQVVNEAMARELSIPGQAAALIRMAWPPVPGDPAVAAAARQRLVGFSSHAIAPLRLAFRAVPPEHQEDAVRALVEAFRTIAGAYPPEYPVAIEEAIWFGTEDAKRVAIPEAGRLRYYPALLTVIDAARDHPALTLSCIDALSAMQDDRARFYLERQLQEGKGDVPARAADALARIGKRAILPLKAALRSDRRSVREAAAIAFLPVATVEDLSTLFEYIAEHPKDDPGTVRAVREVAATLEKLREVKEAAGAASPDSSR